MDKIKVVKDITLTPNHDFIVVKADKDSSLERTKGGIIIPHEVINNKRTQTGTIVGVGPGRFDPTTGNRIPMQSEVGQRIVFALMIGYPVDVGDDRYYIIKDYDAMSVIKEDVEWQEGAA